jgi:hypothetical protein
MYSFWHNYLLFYYFKCWQLVPGCKDHNHANIYKNLKRLVHITQLVNIMGSNSQPIKIVNGIPWYWRVILYEQAFLSFYKHWPDDGLFRTKLVANILNNKIQDNCDRYIFYLILISWSNLVFVSMRKFTQIFCQLRTNFSILNICISFANNVIFSAEIHILWLNHKIFNNSLT